MKKTRIVVAGLAAVSLLGVSACVTDPNTGERKVSRTAIGGVGGAGLGYLLGGIIGGETSGSTEATKTVLIESAYFDPLRTAATGRKTGLVTDAPKATMLVERMLTRQIGPVGRELIALAPDLPGARG